MSSIKLKHSGGNSVSLNPPTSAPTSTEVAFKLPNADGSSGQYMKTDGSGNLSFAAAGGGITHAITYRLNADVTNGSGGVNPVTPWEFSDNAFDGKLENSNTWSLPSSGIFSFPTTGIYSVSVDIMMSQVNDSNAWCGIELHVTTNNGTSYGGAAKIYNQIVQHSSSSTQYTTAHTQAIIDVTDVSQTKYKVAFFADNDESVKLIGDTQDNRTSIKVIRLGDT
tara:strand:+ start:626 stop:1294 length:669 start_codon:yes stop_codon:yes gene_type:complete